MLKLQGYEVNINFILLTIKSLDLQHHQQGLSGSMEQILVGTAMTESAINSMLLTDKQFTAVKKRTIDIPVDLPRGLVASVDEL